MKKKRKQSLFKSDNIRFICLSYAFAGINCLIATAMSPNESVTGLSVMLGIVLLGMVIVSHIDKRKEMREKGYAICCCIMHLCVTLIFSFLTGSFLLMLIYALEMGIYIALLIRNIKKTY